MDNYPEALAPEFEEGGGVATPFDEWWCRVHHSFPSVPEEVARYWLHEHWRHSPFSWLQSRNYEFRRVQWPVKELHLIRSRLSKYIAGSPDCLAHGRHLLNTDYRTARYMNEHKRPPAALVVLDNRDDHLRTQGGAIPAWEISIPASYVLVEGHRRFALALGLQERAELHELPVWVMNSIGEVGRRPQEAQC